MVLGPKWLQLSMPVHLLRSRSAKTVSKRSAALRVRAPEVRPVEVCPVEVCTGDVRIAEVRPAEVRQALDYPPLVEYVRRHVLWDAVREEKAARILV